MDHLFSTWRNLAIKSLLAGKDLARIEADELRDLLDGKIEGCDVTCNATWDPSETLDGRLVEWDGHEFDRLPFDVLEEELPPARDFRNVETWDRCREYDPKVYGWPRDKSRGQSLGKRDWAKIDTIIVHTAAAGLHEDRALGVPCHALVARNGNLVLAHYLDAYLAAAHRANAYSVSLEVSGYRAIEGRQIPAARAWVRYAAAELRRKHAEMRLDLPIKIGPHRLSHSSRVNDCDIEIHRAVTEWAIDELGLVVADVVGSGNPIPSGWWSTGRSERSKAVRS